MIKLLTIGDYSGDLVVYEAQLKQFIVMHSRGIDVTIQGHFSEEIENLLLNKNIPIIKDKPSSKKDQKISMFFFCALYGLNPEAFFRFYSRLQHYNFIF